VLAACGVEDQSATPVAADEPQRARETPRAAPDLPDGSLAALTAEVRQLRLAVEELARSQSETQALGVYLSAQQSRMQQVDAQLALSRRELDTAILARQDLEAQSADLLAAQARATSPEERARLQDAMAGVKYEQAHLDRELQQARSRENDLSRALQSEETRWNDLIARLEALAR
jgi:chromosome segregation ATPase